MATAAKKVAAKTAAKPATGTALAKKANTSVVSIQEALKAQAAEMADRTQPASGITIRVTQDKTFELPDGTKSSGPLELVIVDFVASNKFYEGAYDPKNISPPACFAIGTKPTALVPSDSSPVKQATECGKCPMNQFGSSGNGKACKNSRVLAVLPPDADEDTPIWLLNVSPTALKAFDSYVTSIARTFQAPPVGVVTQVSFDENSTYASLRFGDPQPNEQLPVHFARQGEAKELLTAEPDVSSYETPQPPQRGKAPAGRTARR